jgi:hypothetical protein
MKDKKLVINSLPPEIDMKMRKKLLNYWIKYEKNIIKINCSKDIKFSDFLPKPTQAPKILNQKGI